jgi:hypothetical protein
MTSPNTHISDQWEASFRETISSRMIQSASAVLGEQRYYRKFRAIEECRLLFGGFSEILLLFIHDVDLGTCEDAIDIMMEEASKAFEVDISMPDLFFIERRLPPV